jgi:hypothetical protein
MVVLRFTRIEGVFLRGFSDNWTRDGHKVMWLAQITRVPCVDHSAPRNLIGCSHSRSRGQADAGIPPLINIDLNLMSQLTQVEDTPKLTSYAYITASHRLLFRGSLSVTDSRLLLEGLSFTIPIDNTRSPGINLLKNPLALALESMRGRTLALSGISKVDSVQLDRMAEVDV